MEGLAEAADIELLEQYTPNMVIERLNAALPVGLRARSCAELAPGEKSAASRLRRAVYGITVRTRDGEPDMSRAISDFLSRGNVFVRISREAKAENSFKETDIRGLVYRLEAEGNIVEAEIACGGNGNLKPVVLAQALCSISGITLCEHTTEYCRRELLF
jgi:radical SAM-linked protein